MWKRKLAPSVMEGASWACNIQAAKRARDAYGAEANWSMEVFSLDQLSGHSATNCDMLSFLLAGDDHAVMPMESCSDSEMFDMMVTQELATKLETPYSADIAGRQGLRQERMDTQKMGGPHRRHAIGDSSDSWSAQLLQSLRHGGSQEYLHPMFVTG